MGKVIGIGDYNFGRKNNWRRTVWNEIKSRIDNQPSAKVVYLAGPNDADRKIAVQKGFTDSNMFAVDVDKKVHDKLSSDGKFIVRGDLKATVFNWGKAGDINVVHADLCSGLTAKALEDCARISASPTLSDNGVMLFNFQRGRENGLANQMLKTLQGIKNTKHRGELFFLWHAITLGVNIGQQAGWSPDAFINDARFFLDNKTDELQWVHKLAAKKWECRNQILMPNFMQLMVNFHKPHFYSYRSKDSPVYMDSVLMNVWQGPQKKTERMKTDNFIRNQDKKLKQTISAKKAVRTMRLNGKL